MWVRGRKTTCGAKAAMFAIYIIEIGDDFFLTEQASKIRLFCFSTVGWSIDLTDYKRKHVGIVYLP